MSFKLNHGNSLAIVGESGSGKTSLGLALLKLIPSQGEIMFNAHNLAHLSQKEMRALRPLMQMVFQDPYGSLSPRMTIGDIITEGARFHHKEQDFRQLARFWLEEVDLKADMQDRYPHEFFRRAEAENRDCARFGAQSLPRGFGRADFWFRPRRSRLYH